MLRHGSPIHSLQQSFGAAGWREKETKEQAAKAHTCLGGTEMCVGLCVHVWMGEHVIYVCVCLCVFRQAKATEKYVRAFMSATRVLAIRDSQFLPTT